MYQEALSDKQQTTSIVGERRFVSEFMCDIEDANGWCCILTSSPFVDNSRELCMAIAFMAKSFCLRRYLFPDKLFPLTRILDKVYRDSRSYKKNSWSRSYVNFQKKHSLNCSWFTTLYRSTCWCEVAAHALISIFSENDSNANFLVDADNVFNWINRKVTAQHPHYLSNICNICSKFIQTRS